MFSGEEGFVIVALGCANDEASMMMSSRVLEIVVGSICVLIRLEPDLIARSCSLHSQAPTIDAWFARKYYS
jgi:hypothetical protein